MKRAELEIGGEYYYDRQQNWQDGRWTGGYRAVLVDPGPFRINRGRGYRERYASDPKGNAVLVDIYRDGRDKPDRDVVPTAHLRGPWVETKATVDKAMKARRDREAAESKATEDAAALANSLTRRAEALGLAVSWRQEYREGIQVIMLPDVAARLLDAYEKTQEG